MSGHLLQGIGAAVIVLAAALYATWRLATPSARMRLIGWLAGPSAAGVRASWRARLGARLAPRSAGGCHDCSAAASKVRAQHRARG